MSSSVENKEAREISSNGLRGLREQMANAPVLAFLDRFDSFLDKKKKILSKNEILFSPGENPYLYIVSG